MAFETDNGVQPVSNYIYPESHWTYGLGRNKKIWRALQTIVGPLLRRRLQFTCGRFRVRSKKFIVVANHATDYDPVMLGLMFTQYLRFVTTERVLSKKFFGPILSWLLNPIGRKRAVIDETEAEYIKSNLHNGINVAMFPEGGRTMNGRTGTIPQEIGKLVKEAEGGLVTVRLTRGYLITPLWARERRFGPTAGRVVHEYTRDELDEMTPQQITEAISADLAYDVWEDQDTRRIVYKCKNPAEGMENALFVCPECLRVGTMETRGSDIMCSCGYSLSLDKYGFFSNLNAKFSNLSEWDMWQRNYLAQCSRDWRKLGNEPMCADRGVRLVDISGLKPRPQLDGAMLTLYPDRIQFTAGQPLYSFRIDEIENLVTYKSRSLLFTYRGRRYEISKNENWPVGRYVYMWSLLADKPYM